MFVAGSFYNKMVIIKILMFSFCIAYCRSDLFEGDILLDPKTNAIVNGKTAFDAVASETRKWPGATVPYIFASDFDSARRQVVREAIEEYRKYTCIRFVPRTNQKNYVKFKIGEGCFAYVGMTGGEQPISIGDGCAHKGIVMHEMMHTSGFWHEQSRLDRDNYVRIYWENVKNGRDNNNFKKYSHGEGDYYGEGYDFDSVMHYGNWAFTINEDMTIQAIRDPNRVFGQRQGFSQTDVRQLNKVYRCRGYENVKVPPLTGCIDKLKNCPEWARLGDCDRYKQFMLTKCCKSCKAGGAESACADTNKNCQSWADAGHCQKSPGYMLKNCKKSCRIC